MRAFEHIVQFVFMWGERYPIETALLILTMPRSRKIETNRGYTIDGI